MPYLIDGHNVIHALPDIALDDPHDEVKLILKLRAWMARHRRKAVVVFDGGVPGGPSRQLSTPDVQVVFAARHYTIADRIICERLRSMPDAPNWTVVSSDIEVLESARAVGARTMTAEQFAELLAGPPAARGKPDAISAAEVEAWLAEFGDMEAVAPPPHRPHPPAGAKIASAPSPPAEPLTSETGDGGARVPSLRVSPGREKPDAPTPEEVELWLQHFPNVAAEAPPPQLRRRTHTPSRHRRRPLPVRKEGGLTSEEAEAWLQLFGGEEPSLPPPKRARRSSRLSKRKRRAAPTPEEKAPADIPDEDLQLWYRLFGREE